MLGGVLESVNLSSETKCGKHYTLVLSIQLKAQCSLFPLGVLRGRGDVGVENVKAKSKNRVHT